MCKNQPVYMGLAGEWIKAVVSILCVLAILMPGVGVVGNDSSDALGGMFTTHRVNPWNDFGGYYVVHAIWQPPAWIASEHISRDLKLWI